MKIEQLYCKCDKCYELIEINSQNIYSDIGHNVNVYAYIKSINISKNCPKCDNEIDFYVNDEIKL